MPRHTSFASIRDSPTWGSTAMIRTIGTRTTRWLSGLFVALSFVPAIQVEAQRPTILGYVEAQGTIKTVRPGEVVVTDTKGKDRKFAIQKNDQGIQLGGAAALVDFPATVSVGGTLDKKALVSGTSVRFTALLNRLGRTDGDVDQLVMFAEKQYPPGIKVTSPPEKAGDFGTCQITGKVVSVRRGRLTVGIPENDYVRKERLVFKLADDVAISLESNDYLRAKPGDEVVALRAASISTGDVVIDRLTVKIAEGEERSEAAVAGENLGRFAKYSDEPGQPRELRSANFYLHTDISERSAYILLDKLETMISLVSQYYGRRPKGIIPCYVVRDMSLWPEDTFEEDAAIKIAEPAGVTISRRLKNEVSSIVYSCDDHGVAQHEAVHAYCNQTFGSTGPTWYSEGMAELGNYWKQGQLAVDVDPAAILHLRNTPPKHLLDIVAANQITGDSWQAYQWRWALCHLLAFNPNYSDRFKGLGLALMAEKPGVSFESVYGPVAREISFEYDQFIQHVDNGYRTDLCAWQWDRTFKPVTGKRHVTAKVNAQRGWQASSLRVSANEIYEYAAKGNWKLSDTTEVDADGDGDGLGKLMGVVMQDFKLSVPFRLGTRGKFKAPQDGDLYLRCGDKWNRIADNDGTIAVHLRRAQ